MTKSSIWVNIVEKPHKTDSVILDSLQSQEPKLKDMTALLYLALVSWSMHGKEKKRSPGLPISTVWIRPRGWLLCHHWVGEDKPISLYTQAWASPSPPLNWWEQLPCFFFLFILCLVWTLNLENKNDNIKCLCISSKVEMLQNYVT